MASQGLGPGNYPIPDETHTILVDSFGTRIIDRPARPGDAYAREPIPFHYAGYIHPPGVDPESEAAQRLKRESKRALDEAIFDLSQTEIGRRYLKHAYESKFAFKHDNHTVREKTSAAINDRPSNTLLLGTDISVRALQLTIVHEIGHSKRNIRGLRYFASQVLVSAIRCVRAQEASSCLDEAEHSTECMLITNPNHYKPSGVMEMFKSYQPEVAEAALKAAPLLRQNLKNKFRQAVHIAFYVPANLAFYDRQVIDNFKRWIKPAKPNYALEPDANPSLTYKSHMKTFMMEDWFTHKVLARSLTYLHDADYNLAEPRYTALTNTPEVREAYAQLDVAIRSNQPHTHYRPIYWHFFSNETAALPADRLLKKLVTTVSRRTANAQRKETVPEWMPIHIGPLIIPQVSLQRAGL